MSAKLIPVENAAGATSQRGLPIKADDFHGIEETRKPHSEAAKQQERIWLDMQHAEERVEQLFQSREFCEVRSRLGSALAGQFIRLLVRNQLQEAERYLRSCALPPGDVMHLMRVASEAMDHVGAKVFVRALPRQGPR